MVVGAIVSIQLLILGTDIDELLTVMKEFQKKCDGRQTNDLRINLLQVGVQTVKIRPQAEQRTERKYSFLDTFIVVYYLRSALSTTHWRSLPATAR